MVFLKKSLPLVQSQATCFSSIFSQNHKLLYDLDHSLKLFFKLN
ncbi:hypothetical protein X474_12610 [Dethiosulfatarculus sandiegensis]|uniref:Uncharacterized protein n=1 Tax=Dethiosulfatarculus sandiegensis TaxID=1429043 RepID=A0A0D2JWL3_9BACT|nr:hypothetical protein X474_12610 [Dethiosulfatarculus sandiegensis]